MTVRRISLTGTAAAPFDDAYYRVFPRGSGNRHVVVLTHRLRTGGIVFCSSLFTGKNQKKTKIKKGGRRLSKMKRKKDYQDKHLSIRQ
jgi:hypothetical protein